MIELNVYLAGSASSDMVSAVVENTLGEMKTSDFRRIGVDAVNLRYLNTDQQVAEYMAEFGARIPSFRLTRNGKLVGSSVGYSNYEEFRNWLRTALRR